MAFRDFGNGASGSGLSATPATIALLGGRYGFGVSATWGGGSVTLQALMPDGSTYIDAATAFTADGCTVVDLPPGTYKVTIATATGVMFVLAPIPLRTI